MILKIFRVQKYFNFSIQKKKSTYPKIGIFLLLLFTGITTFSGSRWCRRACWL